MTTFLSDIVCSAAEALANLYFTNVHITTHYHYDCHNNKSDSNMYVVSTVIPKQVVKHQTHTMF